LERSGWCRGRDRCIRRSSVARRCGLCARAESRCLRSRAELEVSPQSLRNWAAQEATDAAEREGLTSEEREELRRLRRENARLKQERDLLKRAAAFFAAETETR
jgi:transposase